jgi:DNA-binding MarR family transcriptional regulator
MLLLGGFEAMVDEVMAGLAQRGHPGVRRGHEFALTAIDAGAGTTSELGRELGVSKQAAAKTVAALQQLGYVTTGPDPADARRQLLRVTDRGHDMTAIGASLFNDVRNRWAEQLGTRTLATIEKSLARVTDQPT